MDEHVDIGLLRTRGAWRRTVDFLCTSTAGRVLPILYLAVLVFMPLSRTAMTFLFPADWQISGYYLGGLVHGLKFLLGAAWLASIAVLCARREIKRGLGRVLASPVILMAGGVITVITMLTMPSTISGWPLDSVYSPSRDKHYILARDPAPTDTIYRIFCVDGTRLNPVWKVEFAGTMMLDYSEDGSLTDNPHLLLSKDEQLLVVGRGGQLTDAILIESRRPLTQFVSFADKDREAQWLERTKRIESLLSEHANPATRPSPR